MYQLWREVWKITERRDGAVYKTEYKYRDWFDEDTVSNNNPGETDLIYVVDTSSTAPTLAIRKKPRT